MLVPKLVHRLRRGAYLGIAFIMRDSKIDQAGRCSRTSTGRGGFRWEGVVLDVSHALPRCRMLQNQTIGGSPRFSFRERCARCHRELKQKQKCNLRIMAKILCAEKRLIKGIRLYSRRATPESCRKNVLKMKNCIHGKPPRSPGIMS